ncbi:hypothetical protein GCM10010345_71320 [Streptomyces canarius]|uniref:Uncharacterized protein n=1 Tax=Streptomyces canarius TaxID=285453 RepID=A0ABQ3D3E5_9ACTN|nr:hypothetical protein GCM10010345_71320 [Streptomyces canarius]
MADAAQEGLKRLSALTARAVSAVAGVGLDCRGDIAVAARSARTLPASTAVGLTPDTGSPHDQLALERGLISSLVSSGHARDAILRFLRRRDLATSPESRSADPAMCSLPVRFMGGAE